MLRRYSALATAVLLISLPLSVRAVPPNSAPPLTLTLIAATAQAIPMLPGLCVYTFYNGDTANLYLGYRSTVTNANGIVVPPGALVSITITFQSIQSGTVIWAYSTGGSTTVTVNEGC